MDAGNDKHDMWKIRKDRVRVSGIISVSRRFLVSASHSRISLMTRSFAYDLVKTLIKSFKKEFCVLWTHVSFAVGLSHLACGRHTRYKERYHGTHKNVSIEPRIAKGFSPAVVVTVHRFWQASPTSYDWSTGCLLEPPDLSSQDDTPSNLSIYLNCWK